jgi:hypothetical protein
VPPDEFKFGPSDCSAPPQIGSDSYLSWAGGLFITAKQLPVGQFHRFRVVKDTTPQRAFFNFTSEKVSLVAWIAPPFYPERFFNQGGVSRIFVFAVRGGGIIPLKGCKTNYGWFFQFDSGSGSYDVDVVFIEGP